MPLVIPTLRQLRRFAIPTIAALALGACVERIVYIDKVVEVPVDPPIGVPDKLQVLAVPTVATPVGEIMPTVVVRVLDALGRGVPGVAVNWSYRGGSQRVAAARVDTVTDARGEARVDGYRADTITVKSENSWYASFRVTAAGVPGFTSLQLPVAPGPVAQIRVDSVLIQSVEPPPQRGLAMALAPVQPSVRAFDRYGNAAWRSVIRLSATGGGSLAVDSIVVGAQGTASVTGWRLGPPGAQSLTLRASSGAELVFPAASVPFRWKRVKAHSSTACATSDADQLYCWGANDRGQLGNGTRDSATAPVRVALPAGVSTIGMSLADSATCSLDATGRVWCWGTNGRGQLGNGVAGDRTTPAQVAFPPGTQVTSITSVDKQFCALDQSGQAWCWGTGHLGDTTATRRSNVPARVRMPPGVRFAHLGAGTCGIDVAGGLWCWSWQHPDSHGAYLDSPRFPYLPRLVPMPDSSRVTWVGEAGAMTYATSASGRLWRWDGYVESPDSITTGSTADAAAGSVCMWRQGAQLNCILRSVGSGGYFATYVAPPRFELAPDLPIAAGTGGAYAITKDGNLLAWGAPDGNPFVDGYRWLFATPSRATVVFPPGVP